MKRILIVAGACCATSLPVAATAEAAQSTARLRSFSCKQAVRPVGRAVAVGAVMRPVRGTKRLALRFELLTRLKPGGPWTAVSAGDLGSWISPSDRTLGRRPGDVWIFNKSVGDLAAPAAYRYRVSFRWFGARQRVLRTTALFSSVCSQPELRPDLAVQSIVVEPIPGHPDRDHYLATIVNQGATAASSFRVQFVPGGGLPAEFRNVPRLAPGRTLEVSFDGPACNTTAASTVTADPDGAVDDANRANNTETAACS
ncbi:MAG: hypothetical protein JO179_22440 [Solirubrobacterales bacterium]|nr:hypothetical protein [Solirubrobacterales bacterium]